MTSVRDLLTRRPALRWLVPGAVAALAISAGAAANAVGTADEDPDLPPRTAAELLVDLQNAQVGALSGTVVTKLDLGLPALPGGGGDPEHADLATVWSGTNTWRVWYDGPERARLALLGTLSQQDVIRNGQDVWMWDSGENHATHWTLPAGTLSGPSPHPAMELTPQEAAEQALAAIEPSTAVSTDDTTRVAGRDAYELVLEPRDDASMVAEVRVAIDAEESIPLGVEVFGQGSEPAIDVGFTQISFEAPDPEQFAFNPPPGTEVTEGEARWRALPFETGQLPEFTTVGQGWTRVFVARLPEEGVTGMLDFVLPEGGTLSGTLFSALRTEDGRVLAGLVTPEYLAEVADDPAAALD
jgi:outer membrane lipoprotein-sorting protein